MFWMNKREAVKAALEQAYKDRDEYADLAIKYPHLNPAAGLSYKAGICAGLTRALAILDA